MRSTTVTCRLIKGLSSKAVSIQPSKVSQISPSFTTVIGLEVVYIIYFVQYTVYYKYVCLQYDRSMLNYKDRPQSSFLVLLVQ